jgi:hypothetical protein
MRLILLSALPVAALVTGGAAPQHDPAPFNGAWMACETYQGANICSYTLTAQRGDRVCGVQRDFATNAYYTQRFIATAKGSRAHIDRICGDPGSETDTYCAGQAPPDAAKVGWGTSDQTLQTCGSRLHSVKDGGDFSCAGARPDAGLPKVRTLDGEGPEPEDEAWMASCLRGED